MDAGLYRGASVPREDRSDPGCSPECVIIMAENKGKMMVSGTQEQIEAYRKEDPMFCQFLEETGRLIVVTPQTQ
jgi:hypothetical protein